MHSLKSTISESGLAIELWKSIVYLSLHFILCQLHLFNDLWALLHYERLLVGVSWDVTVMLEKAMTLKQSHYGAL